MVCSSNVQSQAKADANQTGMFGQVEDGYSAHGLTQA